MDNHNRKDRSNSWHRHHHYIFNARYTIHRLDKEIDQPPTTYCWHRSTQNNDVVSFHHISKLLAWYVPDFPIIKVYDYCVYNCNYFLYSTSSVDEICYLTLVTKSHGLSGFVRVLFCFWYPYSLCTWDTASSTGIWNPRQ